MINQTQQERDTALVEAWFDGYFAAQPNYLSLMYHDRRTHWNTLDQVSVFMRDHHRVVLTVKEAELLFDQWRSSRRRTI